jgi:hypothetical protein
MPFDLLCADSPTAWTIENYKQNKQLQAEIASELLSMLGWLLVKGSTGDRHAFG